MKKCLPVLLLALFVVIGSSPAHAGENPITKFGRGLCNVVTFPFEIFEQSRRVKDKDGSIAGMTYGLGKGLVMSCVRAVTGVYEVATFPLPYPNNYGPILTDPVSFFPEPVKQDVIS